MQSGGRGVQVRMSEPPERHLKCGNVDRDRKSVAASRCFARELTAMVEMDLPYGPDEACQAQDARADKLHLIRLALTVSRCDGATPYRTR